MLTDEEIIRRYRVAHRLLHAQYVRECLKTGELENEIERFKEEHREWLLEKYTNSQCSSGGSCCDCKDKTCSFSGAV